MPAYTLPEFLKMDDAQTSAFGNILTKHGLSPEATQEIIDFGGNALKTAIDAEVARLNQSQLDAWAKTNQEWGQQFDKRAGNRRDTIVEQAKAAVVAAIPDKKARTAFWNALAITGAGNHPDVIFCVAALGKKLNEGRAPGAGVPNTGRNGMTAADRRYGPKS